MIREIDASEADLLVPLNDVVQGLHTDIRPDVFRSPARDDLVEYFKGWLKEPDVSCVVLIKDSVAIGYALFEVQISEQSPLTQEQTRGVLHHLAVLPEFQRQGYGRELVAEVKKRLADQGIEQVVADIWTFNAGSRALFSSLGFTDRAVRMESSTKQ